MRLNRRDLLKGLAAAPVVASLPVVKAEDLVLKFDPPLEVPALAPGEIGTLLTASIIAREFLLQLDIASEKGSYAYHHAPKFADRTAIAGLIGQKVRVRGYDPFELAHRQTIGVEFKVSDLCLSIDDYSDQFIVPSALAMYRRMCDTAAKYRDRRRRRIVCAQLPTTSSYAWRSAPTWRGLAGRVTKDYDINQDEEILRFDVLYGVTRQRRGT